MKRFCILFAFLLAVLLVLCGCGRNSRMIRISDRGVVTEISVSFPSRVSDILHEAEIVLRPGDRTDPDQDTLLETPCDITVLRENVVRLSVNDRTKTVCMLGGTVRDLLEQEQLAPNETLRLNHGLDEWLTDGMEIRLSERCTVEIRVRGQTVVADVEAKTVGEALNACGILPGPDDRVEPELGAPLSDQLIIRVARISYDERQETQPVRYDTRYERDESLAPGSEELIQAGVNGEKLVRFRIVFADGVEESREWLGEEILRDPVEEVIRVGPKDTTGLSIVSRKVFYDCDGSGHGYYEITYSDGSVEYIRF